MIFRSIKTFASLLLAALLTVSCGGDSAPPPTGLTARAGETNVTLSWDMVAGVEYWVFSAPTAVAPTAVDSNMIKWIGILGGDTVVKASSPHVVSGLANGLSYSFSVNGRTDGGPGGTGAKPVTATPVLAGSNWTAGPVDVLAGKNLRSLARGTVYLAAGQSGAMASSADGVSWTAISAATGRNLNGATFYGNYKVVGDAGVALTSTDAVAWTMQSTGTTENLYAIASNNANLNVAVGAKGTIISSPDGASWSAVKSVTSRDLYGVAYGAAGWVAVGAAGTVLQSADGVNWTVGVSGTNADLRGVAAGSAAAAAGSTLSTLMFVATGASGTVLSSSDGTNWTAQSLPGKADLNAVCYGTQFVAVGSGGAIFTSTDGLGWTAAATSKAGGAMYAVARGTLAYAAVGDAGANLSSR